MEMDESGTNVYCVLAFISIVIIMFLLLNIYSVLTESPIEIGAFAYDILLISIMIFVLIVILYMYKKSKKTV